MDLIIGIVGGFARQFFLFFLGGGGDSPTPKHLTPKPWLVCVAVAV